MDTHKVCLISHQGILHGANRDLLALIDGVKQSDKSDRYSLHVVVPEEGPIVDELEMRDVPTSVVPFSWSAHHGDFLFTDRLKNFAARVRNRQPGLSSLVGQIVEWDIDLLYTNTLVIDIGHYSSQKLGLPHVWHIQEFGDRDHGLHPDPGWYIYAQRILASDQIVALSEAVATYLRTNATLFRKQAEMPNLKVVYAGVIDDAQVEQTYERSRTETISGESPLFVIIGQIKPSKGQDVAVKALMKVRESYPRARLAIVGDGEKKWIERVIAEEGAEEAVDLWGYMDGPWEAYAQADVALMCSDSEAMGRVTVEAMIAGTPVIGRDRAGTSELIEHGTTGRLYENGPRDLAREMEWVLSYPTEAERMAENAWEYASHRFTNQRYAEGIMQVWKEALKNRG